MRKTNLRTDATHDRYERSYKDPDFFAYATTVEDYGWVYWRIISNGYPYDAIAEVHHMLIPVRQVAEEGQLTIEEWQELDRAKWDIQNDYDMIVFNFPQQQSQPHWLHYHLLKLKTN